MNLIPTIIEKTNNGERVYDIYSRLLKDRIIFIGGEINDDLANAVISELLFLTCPMFSKTNIPFLSIFIGCIIIKSIAHFF